MSERTFRRTRARETERAERRRRNISKRASLTTGAAIGATVFFAPGAEAANFEVSTLADSGAGSLRDAVDQADAAAGDDTVSFQAGLAGTITLTSGQIVINGDGNLDIQGPGDEVVTVSGDADSDGLPDFDSGPSFEGDSRVFLVTGSSALQAVTISGLTLSGGTASDYYYYYYYCACPPYGPYGPFGPYTEFYEENGGAVAGYGVDVTINSSTISGNVATDSGGGVHVEDGVLTMNATTVADNRAYNDAGGVDAIDSASVAYSVFQNNLAGGSPLSPGVYQSPVGGGLRAGDSSTSFVEVYSSSFTGNAANTTITGDQVGYGGGLVVTSGGNGSISNSTFSTNTAGTGGAGLVANGADLEGLTITGNNASGADSYGGGFVTTDGASLENSVISTNTANTGAGGLAVSESSIGNSTVSGNSAVDGGGLYLGDQATLSNSTVSGNTASSTGGGILLFEAGVVENSTIADNSSENGGGIYALSITDQPSGTVESSAVADNTVTDSGGDLAVLPGTPATDVSFSLIEDVAESNVQSDIPASNIVGKDPELGPLADNGGPTETHLPSNTSPLLDSGIANGLTEDQRGEDRTVDTAAEDGAAIPTDIGSVEVQDVTATGGDDTTDPDTQIDSGPSGTVTTNDVSFTFSAPGETGATFECSLDGAAFAACSSPQAFTDLADGEHTFQVRAVDTAGNKDDTPASRTFTVDTTETAPPGTQIDSGPTGTIEFNDVSFTFSAPGETGATFECSLDGAAFAACSSPQAFTDLADGEHTFQVRAVDTSGNKDDTPASQSFTVDTSDNTPPETSIDSGPSGTVDTNDVSFSFSSPGEPTATFECSIDGAPFGACTSPQDYTDLSDGAHVFQVRAVDAEGNKDADPATQSFNVDTSDTTDPGTQIDTGPTGTVAPSAVSFTFSSPGETGATFECAIDGGAFEACTSPKAYPALADGPHVFQVRAIDTAGNADETPATRAFSVATPDTTAPATTLTTTPPAKVKAKKKKAKVTFEFTSDDSDADFECSIDGAAFAACTSPLTYKAAVGDRTFEVRAVDEAGNADATPATFAFTVKKKKKR